MQQPGCAAIERGRPQFTSRFEADSPAIIGEEGIASTLSPDEEFWIESVEDRAGTGHGSHHGCPSTRWSCRSAPAKNVLLPGGRGEAHRQSSTLTINGLDCSDGRARSTTVNPTSRATSVPVSSQGASAHAERCRVLALLDTTRDGSLSASSISRRATAAESSRRPASFSRQRRSNRRTAAGVDAGSAVRIWFALDDLQHHCRSRSPVNAGRAVSISNRTHPNAHMSPRRSTGFCRACSGDM